MSHFTVLVLTAAEPTRGLLEEILQPWHEYECTGTEDEYVVDVDVTEELQADFAKHGKGRDFDTFADDWSSATKHEDGRWYRRTNPNAKWDWWTVGGRWSGLLPLTAGGEADSAPVAAITEIPSTFAVVKDGRWFERGRMGWFACVSDEKPDDQWMTERADLLADLPAGTWATVVDCHI